MKTVQYTSKNEIRERVQAIKNSWTAQERSNRHGEALRRQTELASLLGLELVERREPALQQAS